MNVRRSDSCQEATFLFQKERKALQRQNNNLLFLVSWRADLSGFHLVSSLTEQKHSLSALSVLRALK